MSRQEIMKMEETELSVKWSKAFLGKSTLATTSLGGCCAFGEFVLPVLRGWDYDRRERVCRRLLMIVEGRDQKLTPPQHAFIYADPIDYVRAMLIVNAEGGE